ncbi:hypothetical protein [uncultured Roseibium sp.]|uniref:hypothetical protein n=1 Tax=uncultured Roseibium sp. TaxID=1936171 RepID=UPI003216B406
MPSTVERPPAANVVAHATEYAPDRDSKGQGDNRGNSSESDAQRHQDETEALAEEPAVLVDSHHHEDHSLDGVAAYTAAAQNVLDPKAKPLASTVVTSIHDRCAAETVRNAYEDHGGEIEHHSVNVAT